MRDKTKLNGSDSGLIQNHFKFDLSHAPGINKHTFMFKAMVTCSLIHLFPKFLHRHEVQAF